MSRSLKKVSTEIRTVFVVYDSSDAAVTGLGDGDFTKRLTKDGANSATAVTIAEVGNGRYTATFTPAATGHFHLLVIHATHSPRGWQEDFDVTTDGAPSLSDITAAILAGVIETGYTLKQTLRGLGAVLLGKTSSAPNATVFRSMDDSADRISASTTDEDGNRTAVTHNL
jgi:hypothetical protein